MRGSSFTTTPVTSFYDGLSPEASEVWFKGFMEFIEPSGSLKEMKSAVKKAMAIDLKTLETPKSR